MPRERHRISKHDPVNLSVEMDPVIPGHTVAKLKATLSASSEHTTEAVISYELTAIGPERRGVLEGVTIEWYESFMID